MIHICILTWLFLLWCRSDAAQLLRVMTHTAGPPSDGAGTESPRLFLGPVKFPLQTEVLMSGLENVLFSVLLHSC